MSANQSTRLKTDLPILDFLYDPETIKTFEDAAAGFIKQSDGTTMIWAASRDWFLEEWGRDTFVSLPGLLLTTGRFEEARQVFSHFIAYEKNGLIPNVIREEILYNTADASLWFIHALKAYVATTEDWDFVAKLLPRVRNIIRGYSEGTIFNRGATQYQIKMDEADGLIISPSQATWMDADPSGTGSQAVTPRIGKCVDINALWYGALRFLIVAEKQLHDDADTAALESRAVLVRQSFQDKFWNYDVACLYDYIDGDDEGKFIRPNQIIAISHGGDLLDTLQKEQVVMTVTRELLTPGGLRTLSRRDAKYCGNYDTFAPMTEKDWTYHQGTVWPWLIGPYCDAVRMVSLERNEDTEAVNRKIGVIIAPLVLYCLESEFKSLPEVFSGDEPFEPGGTTSQAWSIAEVLRILKTITN